MGDRGQTTIQLAEYSDYFVTFDVVKKRYDASEINEERRPLLKKFYEELLKLDEWNAEIMEAFTKDWVVINESSMKETANPLRWALTGRKVSPGVFNVAEQLGRKECNNRLKYYDLLD